MCHLKVNQTYNFKYIYNQPKINQMLSFYFYWRDWHILRFIYNKTMLQPGTNQTLIDTVHELQHEINHYMQLKLSMTIYWRKRMHSGSQNRKGRVTKSLAEIYECYVWLLLMYIKGCLWLSRIYQWFTSIF